MQSASKLGLECKKDIILKRKPNIEKALVKDNTRLEFVKTLNRDVTTIQERN